MTAPNPTGPMYGDWRPSYMRTLQNLKDEVNKELDRAQVGGPEPEPDTFIRAIGDVLEARDC